MPDEKKGLVEVKAYRGYYVFANDFIAMLDELITDAENSKNKISVLGNPAREKLDGALMSMRGMKDMIVTLEKYGDLILLPDPKGKEQKPNVDTVGKEDSPKPEKPKLIIPTEEGNVF